MAIEERILVCPTCSEKPGEPVNTCFFFRNYQRI
jgi:hypothetical protein